MVSTGLGCSEIAGDLAERSSLCLLEGLDTDIRATGVEMRILGILVIILFSGLAVLIAEKAHPQAQPGACPAANGLGYDPELVDAICKPAPAKSVYRSQSWWFSGKCDGGDQVYKWHIFGLPEQASWHIKPWMPIPLLIRGIELTQYEGVPNGWWGAGNGIIGDMMLFLPPNERHGRHDFPAGMVMPMPAAKAARETDYLDLHGLCFGGSSAALWYTIYYTYD